MAIYNKIVAALVIMVAVAFHLIAEPDIAPSGYVRHGQLDPLSLNQQAVQVVVDLLIDQTAQSGYNYYTWAWGEDDNVCRGNGRCRFGISADDCMTCLTVAETIMKHVCGYPGAAIMTLKDCSLRWQFNIIQD